MSTNVHIYASDNLSADAEKILQEETLENEYGDSYIYLVTEDNSLIANETETSVLIQEYF